MHTVIITDSNTTPLFEKHKWLFAPFLIERGGSVCHCSWDEANTAKPNAKIDQAVPDLYRSIRGHLEWRAIILIDPVKNEPSPFSPNNPFDFYCNRVDDGLEKLLLKENNVPLIRLTHMLAGFPSLGVKSYDMGYTYFNTKSGKYEDCLYNKEPVLQKNLRTLSDAAKTEIRNKYGQTMKPRLIENKYLPDEKADHKKLTEQYGLNENRPVEVLVLSTRKIFQADDPETTRETIRHAWEFHDEEESSGFWKIYPNTCRFLCYDLINPEHTLYQRDLWRLFLLTLTLAVNQIPGQALHAYRLYKADLKINADKLRHVLEEHIENLLSIQAIIQERMLRSPELTQEKKKELVPIQDISVKFEQVDESDVRVKGNKLGLASDCPIPETRFWYEHIQGTKQTIDNILSSPQEIVVDKAIETRRKSYDFSGREQVLDRFQIERIKKRIEEIEPQVMNANVYGILDPDARKAEVAEAGDIVRKHIGLRLTKRKVLLISLCALLTYLCGYIPYLINSAKISRPIFGVSFGLALIALVLLAAGGLLTLWVLRRKLMQIIKTYNKTFTAIFDHVNKSAYIFSGYFSSVCTYMYARSLLSGIILKHDSTYTEKKALMLHLNSLASEIEKSKDLCSLHDVPLDVASTSSVFVSITEDVLLEPPHAGQFYELKPNKTKNTLELDNTGETLDAPYIFIAGMSLVREEIYNKK